MSDQRAVYITETYVFGLRVKQYTAGLYLGATGLTGLTVHWSTTLGGEAIHPALSKTMTAASGVTGGYEATFTPTEMKPHLAAFTGQELYLVVRKAGEIESRSFKRLVLAEREGDG